MILMAKNTTNTTVGQEQAPAVAAPEATPAKENYKVRFIKNGARAAGCIWARGAVTTLTREQAQVLQELGSAEILGSN